MNACEVQRALRLITSPQFRRRHWFPISVLANMSGLSREAIYQARAGNLLTPRVVNALAPILTDILAGRMTAKRDAWQVVVKEGRMEEHRFSKPGPARRVLKWQERELEWG